MLVCQFAPPIIEERPAAGVKPALLLQQYRAGDSMNSRTMSLALDSIGLLLSRLTAGFSGLDESPQLIRLDPYRFSQTHLRQIPDLDLALDPLSDIWTTSAAPGCNADACVTKPLMSVEPPPPCRNSTSSRRFT